MFPPCASSRGPAGGRRQLNIEPVQISERHRTHPADPSPAVCQSGLCNHRTHTRRHGRPDTAFAVQLYGKSALFSPIKGFSFTVLFVGGSSAPQFKRIDALHCRCGHHRSVNSFCEKIAMTTGLTQQRFAKLFEDPNYFLNFNLLYAARRTANQRALNARHIVNLVR
jgi:hypothetical protein